MGFSGRGRGRGNRNMFQKTRERIAELEMEDVK
jgi:hypothetical protein